MIPLLLFRKKDKPTLDLSFLGGGLPDGMTFSRASAAWRFDESGALTQETTNAPRFDFDPVNGGMKGLLLEEQRTNSVRNSVLAGAVAGSPGTLPTYNYTTFVNVTGLSYEIAATGTEYGMPYVDVRVYGTASGTGNFQFKHEIASQIAAVQNEVWTASSYMRVVGGTLANVSTVAAAIIENNSGGSYLTGGVGAEVAPTSTLTRYTYTRTLSNVSTAYTQSYSRVNIASAGAVDVTIRFYQPQMEKGSFATSPIVTTGSAATRAADSLYAASLPWFNATEGSFAVEASSEGYTSDLYGAVFADGTNSNMMNFYVSTSTQKPYGRIYESAATKVSGGSLTAIAAGAVFKQAMRYKNGDNYQAANGALDTAGTMAASALPSGINRLDLGNRKDGQRPLNGWLRRFRYWNAPLSDAQLVQVTQ